MASTKIFLVLGIAREPKHWKSAIEVLQQTFPAFEIIALKNPGTSVHCKMNVPLSIEAQVEFLKKQYDTVKGDTNYFVGWSMGGMIVSLWAKLYPKDINGMTLITTSFGSLTRLPLYRLRPLIIPSILTAIFSKGMKREEMMYATICNNETNKQALLPEWLAIQAEHPITGVNILRQVVACVRFVGTSLIQQHPVLIIGAPNDKLVNNKCSTSIAKMWKKAKYIEHPTAGHDVFLDEPQWVSIEMKKWLATIPS
jgi:pimeloyl-ACP methyl ester carboxylesterase